MSTKQTYLPITTTLSGGRRHHQPQKWRASTIRCLLLSAALFTLMLWTTLSLFGLQYANDDGNDSASSTTSSSSLLAGVPTPKATIAYAVSLTSCGDTRNGGGHSSDPSFHEGAAVLKHSIHLASIRNYHQSKSVFDYEVRRDLFLCTDVSLLFPFLTFYFVFITCVDDCLRTSHR